MLQTTNYTSPTQIHQTYSSVYNVPLQQGVTHAMTILPISSTPYPTTVNRSQFFTNNAHLTSDRTSSFQRLHQQHLANPNPSTAASCNKKQAYENYYKTWNSPSMRRNWPRFSLHLPQYSSHPTEAHSEDAGRSAGYYRLVTASSHEQKDRHMAQTHAPFGPKATAWRVAYSLCYY
jgi:hypothetical protein